MIEKVKKTYQRKKNILKKIYILKKEGKKGYLAASSIFDNNKSFFTNMYTIVWSSISSRFRADFELTKSMGIF